MKKVLGKRLLEEGLVTGADLQAALDRMRTYGGRLGSNLVALGRITEADLARFFDFTPKPPRKPAETHLDENVLRDLVLKHALMTKKFSIQSMVGRTKLHANVIAEIVGALKNDGLIEIAKGNTSFSTMLYEYNITEVGLHMANGLMEECRYVGPAPVSLEDYREAVEIQTIKSLDVTEADIRKSFSDIVVSETMFQRLGAAINSGKPIFLYGPAGGGKTTIAECIGRSLPGEIYIPYALLVGGQIIVVYDQVSHEAVPQPKKDDDEGHDQRWIRVKRPIVMAGGEMTLKTLDLEFNPNSKYYEAPLQVKAGNGIFVVDDFGRQLIDPQSLLNRWIVPLDRRVDFLSLHTGMKFEIPFDQLVIFATNLEPEKLADEAFLRRLRYKIKINYPTPREYRQIFEAVCDANRLPLDEEVFDYLIRKYDDAGIKPIGCHPRDLVDHMIDEAYFKRKPPAITRAAIDFAWMNYFVDL
ncbi:ATPase AAA [Desulfococcus multivorans]|uniref:AAA ATPase n=1 Tax=Desulfococcus multivorans DSM 2059 TaxID=1121405 RepID=S7TCH6_DESML|nr:ATPase AAA [Desulfococcus multivorans]AOY58747.1 AAA ATPase [Desulfococcus multivorans]AQV01031.1 ATPase [Desulfococcus multivorans]EPR34341.1 AAA ATPase [Desulfococcus multivorans DSM 2059]SJZ49326.1 hypothetical protein SAMN02745446_00669 [Desulfococcus multivorans DSM 2059]